MIPSTILIDALKTEIPLIREDKIPKGFRQTVDMMFTDGNLVLDRERFNILASYWKLPPANKEFFDRYFPSGSTSILDLKKGVDRFIVDALWHFGDLERAYFTLCEMDGIDDYFNEHSFHVTELKKRLPWKLVEQIAPAERGFLGYVSGQRPKQQQDLLGFAELVVEELDDNNKEYQSLSSKEISDRILEKLSKVKPEIKEKIEEFEKLNEIKNLDLFSSKELETTKQALATFRTQIDETIEKVERLKEIGKKNHKN